MVIEYAKKKNILNFMKWPRLLQDVVLGATLGLMVFASITLILAFTRATDARDEIRKEAVEADQRFCTALPSVIAEALQPFGLPPALLNEVILRTNKTLQEKGACPARR